jgi:two-component system, chemotaxis family, protein-glutamate methylesterase/glutaminase
MPGRDIVVVGASAGGVEALINLVRRLPRDLPAAVFVVLHIPPNGSSALPQILTRYGPLAAKHAADGEPIQHGQIYVAPPDHHLLVVRGAVRVLRGPRENGARPAADPLFRTAAQAYRQRVVGVVLSGLLDDGSSGLTSVKRNGGVAVVQDPNDATFRSMPQSALDVVAVDYCVPTGEIGDLLGRLATEEAGEGVSAVAGERESQSELEQLTRAGVGEDGPPGPPSMFTCPECHGSLWEMEDGNLARFRCRVGHAYSPDSLLADQGESLEAALWEALRALEERASLARRLVERAAVSGLVTAIERFQEQARDADARAAIVRRALMQEAPPGMPSALDTKPAAHVPAVPAAADAD